MIKKNYLIYQKNINLKLLKCIPAALKIMVKRLEIVNGVILLFIVSSVKIITTGEGGAVLTNNKDLFEKVNILKTHGITRNPNFMKNNKSYWYYEQIDIGYNLEFQIFMLL